MEAYLRLGMNIAQLLVALMVGMTGAWAKPNIVEYLDNEYNFAFQYPSDWKLQEVPKGNEFGETRVMLRSPSQGVAFWVMISHVDGKSVSREKFNNNPNRDAILEQFIDDFLIEQMYKKASGLNAEKMIVRERRAVPCNIGIKVYISTVHFLRKAIPISLAGIHIAPFGKEYMVHFMMSTVLDSKAEEEKETLTNIFNSFHLIGESPISDLTPTNHRRPTSQDMVARIVFSVIGLIFGLFAFSQIVYPLFSAWPRAKRLEREGKLKKSIPVYTFIISPIMWSAQVIGSILLVKKYFSGYLGFYLIALGFILVVVIAQIPKRNRDLEADFKLTWGKYLRDEDTSIGTLGEHGMDLAAIEASLRERLPTGSIQNLEGFPSDSYSDFLTQHRAGQLKVLTAYDSGAFQVLASRGRLTMHYILTWSPAVVALALVVSSIAQRNFWLLLGVPLAFFGFFFTTPGLMRRFGYTLLLIVGGSAVYSWFQGNHTAAYILGAYAVPNFLVDVARWQCDTTIREAIGRSEIVLVWLYLKGSVLVKK